MANRVSQVTGQVLAAPTGANARVSQVTGQVLAAPTGANARVSQVTGQVLGVPTNANARVSQVTGQVWVTHVLPQHRASGYVRDGMINHLFRTANFVKPVGGLWVALYVSVSGDIATWIEASGGSYARAFYPALDANWAAPTGGGGATSNLLAVAFPVPTVSWGTVIGYAIVDAPTGGHALFYGTLATPQAVTVGTAPQFAIGDLSATIG